jgi:hypothetical protein
MKKFILGLVSLLFSINLSVSQNVSLMSLPQKTKIKTATNVKFIGTIDESIYFYVENSLFTKTKLLKYNKENTKLSNIVDVRGFSNKEKNPLIKDAIIGQIFITADKKIRIFWFVEQKNIAKVLYSDFDHNLREIKKPQVIYQLQNKPKAFSNAKLFALMSNDGQKFIIGGEESTLKQENVSIQYKIFNDKLVVENSYTADLPYSVINRNSSIITTSDYRISNNGDMFYYTNINLGGSKERKNKSETGYLLGKVNSSDGKNSYQIIAFDTKNIYNLKFEFLTDHIMAFGIYYSVGDNNDNRNYGIFSVKLDIETLEAIDDIKFNILDDSKLAFTNLFMSPTDKKKYTPEKFAMTKIRSNGLRIEDFIKINNEEVILVLSSSYVIITQSQNSSSATTYHVANVYVKLNKAGEIDWFSCTHIGTTYSGYKDLILPMIDKDEKIYLVDRGYKIGESKKIDYNLNTLYVVDQKTGNVITKAITALGKEEIRFVANNEFFVINNKQTFKPEACVGAIIFFPSIVFTQTLRNSTITFGKYNID